ncbi:MAG: hypothetical protein ABH834_05865 [Candidatus Altiarchaeota archaeon]
MDSGKTIVLFSVLLLAAAFAIHFMDSIETPKGDFDFGTKCCVYSRGVIMGQERYVCKPQPRNWACDPYPVDGRPSIDEFPISGGQDCSDESLCSSTTSTTSSSSTTTSSTSSTSMGTPYGGYGG